LKKPTVKNSELAVEVSGAVASLEINRSEKMNSLSPDVLFEIVRALEKLKSEGLVRCVILSGRGGKAFSSGYDFSFIGSRDMLRDYEKDKHPLAAACEAVENFPRPVLAMVCGYAVGGGLELATACDMIICSENSKFSMPPAKLGIAYPLSGLRRISGLIGFSNARRMFFAAETFTAREALQMGLVCEAVPAEFLRDKTYQTARRIAGNAPLSTEAAKLGLGILRRSENISSKDKEEMRKTLEKAQNSADFKEGIKSVSEKRKPFFEGC